MCGGVGCKHHTHTHTHTRYNSGWVAVVAVVVLVVYARPVAHSSESRSLYSGGAAGSRSILSACLCASHISPVSNRVQVSDEALAWTIFGGCMVCVCVFTYARVCVCMSAVEPGQLRVADIISVCCRVKVRVEVVIRG